MISNLYNQNFFSSYNRDKFIRINLFFSLVINILIWLWLSLQIRALPELIPLHYNIYFGIDLLGYWYQVFLMPFFGILVILLNFFLGSIIYQKEKILSKFLAGTSSFIQVIIFLASIFIILINK